MTKTQSIFDGSPRSNEIDYHINNDPVFWSTATPSEAIDEIKYIRDTYYEEGHIKNEGILEGAVEVKRELKEIKDLIKYLENKLKVIK
jgi:hypothetical protein|tara:strand:- start:350 stop:613 length:264 start_codon:yes stop_codon:yes gene_type:complete